MEPIEYFTLPELPGKPMFHCARRSASLQVSSCAALWSQTNNNKSPECSQLCKSCPIGAHHAGEGDIAQSSLCGIPICSRCQRTGLRLIGHDICVSCWNRERECVIGRNARGRKPLNHPPLVPHAVTVMTGGNVVTVRGEVRRAGAVVPVSWPLHVVNPPYSDVERLVDDVGALA